MNKEFKELYDKWYYDTCFLSSRDFNHEQGFIDLVNWSKEHKKEAVDSIQEMLLEEPSFVVYILDELFDHPITCEGFIPLDYYCNAWLSVIELYKEGKTELTAIVDHYEDYRAYHKYMKKHYIPWNPFHEDDPNITLEEFRQGKRNEIHTVI